jgi:shikimate dehydrogenase
VAPTDLERVVGELKTEGAAGNVTVPHKRGVMLLCDQLSSIARRTEAVNTFFVRSGALIGDNTDVAGFHSAVCLLLGREPGKERVALLGAGGAASAVLAAVESWPDSRAKVFNRHEERGRLLVHSYSDVAAFAANPAAALQGATLVVNATPVGISGDDLPIDPELLPDSAALLDLVYRKGETPFVRLARARGLRAADGMEMLLEQGARSFVQWFGCAPDKMVMREALKGAIMGG